MAESTNQPPPLLKGAAVIGQSGGPTAVINQSLVGVVETLRGHDCIEQVLGAQHAVSGIVKDRFIPLHDIPQDRLDRIAQTPSAALGSSRDKPDQEYCKKILEVFEKRNVRYFFYIGGNDSSDTCRIINDLAGQSGYELRCFHVPKTIDNDLVLNDHAPGFGSAAKFVAQAFIGDNLDNRSIPGIKINVIMGRHAGFLTAASILARQHKDDGPHLIYVPEVPLDLEKFANDVKATYDRIGRCLIAVSEGVHDSQGVPIVKKLAQQLQTDAHGNIQLSGTGALGDHLCQVVRDKLGAGTRIRADTFGYLQRCFAGCISTIDAQEAREVGSQAAKAALSGQREGSIAIQRAAGDPYRPEYRLIKLSDVAGKTQTLDPKYIVNDNDIDKAFKDYLNPLVGSLPVTESLPF